MRCVICGRALTTVAHQVSGGVVGPKCAVKSGLNVRSKKYARRVVLFSRRAQRARVEQGDLFAEVLPC